MESESGADSSTATREPSMVVTSKDIAAADASYDSFPDFESWQGLDVPEELWADALARSQELRAHLSERALNRAVTQTMRLAAIDTGAIEGLYDVNPGFTYAVAEQAATWEVEIAERGEHVRPLFESQLEAYELILDAATKQTPISEAFIRRVHEVVTSAQDSYLVYTPQGPSRRQLPKGEYKKHPNHPWGTDGVRHAYAPVASVSPEMHRLASTMRSDSFLAAHPILQASYVHYALAQIHPFADGNGRLARALASVYLYRAASIPFLLFADQKPQYLDALAAADRGKHQAFVAYFAERAVSGLNRFTEILRAAEAPDLEESLAALRSLNVAVGSLSYAELDARLASLAETLATTIDTQIAELRLPDNVRAARSNLNVPDTRSSPYRPAISQRVRGSRITFTSLPPGQAELFRDFYPQVARDRNPTQTFQILSSHESVSIEIPLADTYPDLTADARYRISVLVRGALAEGMAELLARARQQLQAQGY